ncbi:MAG: UPF0489 family protein [Clostridia bacterium]|nr:UPF0489 family protein [Clostridia bacterium]
MILKMPFLMMEEHHEAFYYWGLAVKNGWIAPRGNVLFHVDHHDDLVGGGYIYDFSRPFADLEERKIFTYSHLGIADFIVPALYEGLFSKMFNMKGLVKQAFSCEERLVRLCGKNVLATANYIPFLHADKRRNNAAGYSFYTYHEGALSDTEPLENVVLDIDLDYFCWDDELCTVPPKRMEITKEAYEEFCEDPYHPFRILPRAMLQAEKEGTRYYIRYVEMPINEKPADEMLIRNRVDRFFNWLRNQPWEPSLVTICRSAHSGYLPQDKAGLVEELVCKGLKELWA